MRLALLSHGRPASKLHRLAFTFIMAMTVIACPAVLRADDGTVPAGGCAELNGHIHPTGVAHYWQIWRYLGTPNEVLIASIDDWNGWSVTVLNYPNPYVCAPANAATGSGYYVQIGDATVEDVYANFTVGTGGFVMPNRKVRSKPSIKPGLANKLVPSTATQKQRSGSPPLGKPVGRNAVPRKVTLLKQLGLKRIAKQ